MVANTEHKDIVRRRVSVRKRRVATLTKLMIGGAGLAALAAWVILLVR